MLSRISRNWKLSERNSWRTWLLTRGRWKNWKIICFTDLQALRCELLFIVVYRSHSFLLDDKRKCFPIIRWLSLQLLSDRAKFGLSSWVQLYNQHQHMFTTLNLAVAITHPGNTLKHRFWFSFITKASTFDDSCRVVYITWSDFMLGFPCGWRITDWGP